MATIKYKDGNQWKELDRIVLDGVGPQVVGNTGNSETSVMSQKAVTNLMQQKLVAGDNITINGNIISASTGGGGARSLSDLTDWSPSCLNVDNNLCVSGTVTARQGMYTSSDISRKDNIDYLSPHDISLASQVKLKEFTYKDDPSGRKIYGVIAQDVEAIGLNNLVHYDEDGLRAVDYTGLLLLKLAALENEIAVLKHKLEEKEK